MYFLVAISLLARWSFTPEYTGSALRRPVKMLSAFLCLFSHNSPNHRQLTVLLFQVSNNSVGNVDLLHSCLLNADDTKNGCVGLRKSRLSKLLIMAWLRFFLCKNPTAQPWDITVKTSKSKGRDFGSPREFSYDFLTSKIKQPISRFQSYEIPAWKKIERLRLTFMSNSKREFVPRDRVSIYLSFTVHYFYK